VGYRPFDYSAVSHRGWPLRQRISRRVLVAVLRRLVRLEVSGLENLPAEGPYILAANHLHVLDPAIGLLLVPRRAVGLAKDRWSRPPFGWLLGGMGDLVYVGRNPRGALATSIEVLRSGAVLAILPEGTRSPTGALLRGQRGVAMVAARAPAPIVPAAAYGQERAMESWRRLRRVLVRVRIGRPVEVPAGTHSRERLQAQADDLMRTIAAMLPPEYRGVYAEPGGWA
jgi:1-acyl-sn-glycerol-3-phosphate acyltransferase